ncbi:MAG: Hsp20/alpha crystallin family protein [Candidatus Carbobacillus altaicus]|nr:Hsp20/alpha crystallin family protein [Candidatus Carbobacillus altaicus]
MSWVPGPWRRKRISSDGLDFPSVNDLWERFWDEPWPVLPFAGRFRSDIRETDDAYIVEAELPGVDKDAIDLAYHDGVLSIVVEENRQVEEKKEDQYLRRERYRGRMERHFSLENVEADGITATFKDGLLTVTLPKRKKTPPSHGRIQIQD